MAKATTAFRTISEVSDDLDVPKHVLRFWEARFPQIKPMKRGGGRRFYRPEDMELLRGIRHLLHGSGYTIKGVQKILREQGIDAVKVHGRSQSLTATGMPETSVPAAASADVLQRKKLLRRIADELEQCLKIARSSGPALPLADDNRQRRAS